MSFIDSVPEKSATSETGAMYARAREAFGYLPNMTRAFSHRPEVMQGWNALISSIRTSMDGRRYELVTLAAARELRSSYCMLAHSVVLMREHFDAAEMREVATSPDAGPLTDTERAIMRFAANVVRDATAITAGDVDELRGHGLSDAEIFDVVAAAAARCFFSKTLDALGVRPDAAYRDVDETVAGALVLGRPVDERS